MTRAIQIIRKNEQKTSLWAGGITTQIAIYPRNAEYTKRNFKWRLSSAQVDIEQSTFTHLPGIWRFIMVIDGEMVLEHEGHHRVLLKPFEQDSFSGEWTTHSFGKVKDFNLMLGEGCRGELHAFQVNKGISYNIASNIPEVEEQRISEAFYCVNGRISIIVNESNDSLILGEGDLILINRLNSERNINIIVCNEEELTAQVIRAIVFY